MDLPPDVDSDVVFHCSDRLKRTREGNLAAFSSAAEEVLAQSMRKDFRAAAAEPAQAAFRGRRMECRELERTDIIATINAGGAV
jgi:hypothetical protein